MSAMFDIVEIFSSIEGEGKRVGQLATFIRLAGCNLRCSYCDTTYAQNINAGQKMTIGQIMEKVVAFGNVAVTVTGGEPLHRKNIRDLLAALADADREVNVETNGSLPLPEHVPAVFYTMDWKSRSSGEWGAMLPDNLSRLTRSDVLKFVIQESDFADIRELLHCHNLECMIYFSPIYGKVEPARVVEFMQKLQHDGLNTGNMRMQLQLHKQIWPPDMRGV